MWHLCGEEIFNSLHISPSVPGSLFNTLNKQLLYTLNIDCVCERLFDVWKWVEVDKMDVIRFCPKRGKWWCRRKPQVDQEPIYDPPPPPVFTLEISVLLQISIPLSPGTKKWYKNLQQMIHHSKYSYIHNLKSTSWLNLWIVFTNIFVVARSDRRKYPPPKVRNNPKTLHKGCVLIVWKRRSVTSGEAPLATPSKLSWVGRSTHAQPGTGASSWSAVGEWGPLIWPASVTLHDITCIVIIMATVHEGEKEGEAGRDEWVWRWRRRRANPIHLPERR